MTVDNLIPTGYENLDMIYALCKRYVSEGKEHYIVTVFKTLDSAISCGVDSIAGFSSYRDARIMAIDRDTLDRICDLHEDKIVNYGQCVSTINRVDNDISVWRVVG